MLSFNYESEKRCNVISLKAHGEILSGQNLTKRQQKHKSRHREQQATRKQINGQ